ncbi:hypothetical protein ACIQB5_07030 [Streptomyces sp. NPDC088560]|uniref:hypothetical protein n=1 Tax=Streptomyces sp. NPDC088560 TaxID=3365868 RepID=UPI00380FADDD
MTVLLGMVLCGLTTRWAVTASVNMLDRDSGSGAGGPGCAWSLFGRVVLLAAAFWTPLSAPGPAGAWGQGLAALVGLR